MLNGKYVSYKRILEKLHQDYGFKDKIEWSVVLEWIGDGMDLIGANETYINKVTGMDALTPTIKIEGYRGALPCDLYKCIQAREYCTKTPMRYSTDTFHLVDNTERSPNYNNNSDYTYQFNNNYIFTNFKTGEVEMSYIAFPIDDDGYPMIPDDVKFIRAMVDHVASMILKRQLLNNEISMPVYRELMQDIMFSMAAAHTRATLQNLDQAESFKNALLRSIPKLNHHSDGFVYLGQQEQRYII